MHHVDEKYSRFVRTYEDVGRQTGPMAIHVTVGDLVADPILNTQVLAGHSGLEAHVRWAQTSEAPDPWTWLGEGELLMTLGLNLPHEPAAQAGFVRRAREAGIVGMSVGDDGYAPVLSEAMLATADLLGFPLLLTGHSTPFVVISRTVAAATNTAQGRGVLVLSRLYQEASLRGRDLRSTSWIHGLTGVWVSVMEQSTGSAVLGPGGELGAESRRHPLDTDPATYLQVDADLDPLILIHLKQVLATDAQAVLREALDAARHGAEQISAALDPAATRAAHPGGAAVGGAHAVGQRTYRVLAVPDGASRLALSLALAGYPAWVGEAQGVVMVVSAEEDLDGAQPLVQEVSVDIGISQVHARMEDVGAAVREAADALTTGKGITEFVPEPVSLLARSVTEARQIVEQVLGPLQEESHAALRDTLFTVLEADLSMQRAAETLGIHRQSLGYRLKRIRDLTGHNVHRVPDLTRLWLAHEAWSLLHAA